MARLLKWHAPHVKLETIEELTGRTYVSFREYRRSELDLPISIRVLKKDWNQYGLEEALAKLGLSSFNVVYINI